MRRAVTATGVVIAAAGLIAGGVVAAASGASRPADTFVASVPWSSAVVASASARAFSVSADVEGMDDRFDCGPVVKSKVTETSRTVTVRVQVFNHPLPPGVACGGVGLVTVPATVHLASALGDRILVDGTNGQTHRALVVATTPAPSSVPKPFVRKSTGWDESTGQVSEWWRWQEHGQAQQLDLDFGPTSTAARWGSSPSDASDVSIGRSTGAVWRQAGADTVTTTVTWSPTVGEHCRLTLIDQSLHPMSEAAVVALARSVR